MRYRFCSPCAINDPAIAHTCHVCWIIARALALGITASVIVFAIWAGFMAQPLRLTDGKILNSPVAGKKFYVRWEGHKPWWSDRACAAISSSTTVVDVDAKVYQWQTAFGYNDGSITHPIESHRLPEDIQTGRGLAWHRVTYKCWSVQHITVQSPKIPIVIVRE